MFKRRKPHPTVGKRVLINLKTGNAISGVVDHDTAEHLMVVGASLHSISAPDKSMPMDGVAVVDLSNVDWIEIA